MKNRFTVALLVALAACAKKAENEPAAAPPPPPPPLKVSFTVATDAGFEARAEGVFGEPFAIHVSGAEAGQSVRVVTKTGGFLAEATFTANAEGSIDTSRDAPTSGSYRGVDIDGLLWSATVPTDAETYDVQVLASAQERSGKATFHRLPFGAHATETPVETADFKGVLWSPKAAETSTDPRPALLVLGGSECMLGIAEAEAGYIASLGYHALAIEYCNAEHVIEAVPLEKLRAAVEWLGKQRDVDPNHVGVLGLSRGGELALQLAALDERITAVVAVMASPYRWSGTGPKAKQPAWTWKKKPLPFIAEVSGDSVREPLPDGGVGVRSTPAFMKTLEQLPAKKKAAATIPFASSNAQFFLVGAEDDALWPSCALATDAWALLLETKHQVTHKADQKVCLPLAGHVIAAPGMSVAMSDAFPSMTDGAPAQMLGGTLEGRGRAARAFDQQLQRFLAQVFAPE